MATWTASTRLRRAAAAVRTLALTLMNMPMIPEAIEQAAPTRNAIPVRQPRSKPLYWVSATCLVTRAVITPVITTEPTRAKMPMVEYWRRMKATAPSKIVPATSCISLVPVSRRRTSRARYSAKRTAIRPAGRMISLRVEASMRLSDSSWDVIRSRDRLEAALPGGRPTAGHPLCMRERNLAGRGRV